jgi:hypothetical protein
MLEPVEKEKLPMAQRLEIIQDEWMRAAEYRRQPTLRRPALGLTPPTERAAAEAA